MNGATLTAQTNKTDFTADEVAALINAHMDAHLKEQAVKQAVIHDKLNNEARFIEVDGIKYLHEDFVKSLLNQLK